MELKYSLKEYIENKDEIRKEINKSYNDLDERIADLLKTYTKIFYTFISLILFVAFSIIGIKLINNENIFVSVNSLIALVLGLSIIFSLTLLYNLKKYREINDILLKIDINGKIKEIKLKPEYLKKVSLLKNANYYKSEYEGKSVEEIVEELKRSTGKIYYYEAMVLSELIHGSDMTYRLIEK